MLVKIDMMEANEQICFSIKSYSKSLSTNTDVQYIGQAMSIHISISSGKVVYVKYNQPIQIVYLAVYIMKFQV